jgi:hypothetical protein
MERRSASSARRAIALAALLASTAGSANAGDLGIDSLQITAQSGLHLTVPQGYPPTATVLVNTADAQINADGLLPPPTVVATAVDPFGLSLATASQSNTGIFRDHVVLVNDYPVHGPFGVPLPLTVDRAFAATQMGLTVGALSPDAPLDMTLHVFGGQLRGADYYGASRLSIRLDLRLTTQDAFGNHDIPWEWSASLDLNTGGLYTGWTSSTTLGHDAYGIGAPTTHFDRLQQDFTSTARVTIDDFVAHPNFGLLQPGQHFQLVYSGLVDITGTWAYSGPQSGAEADLVDPLSLGGQTARAPIAIAGLAFPSAVPEPGAPTLLLAGRLKSLG